MWQNLKKKNKLKIFQKISNNFDFLTKIGHLKISQKLVNNFSVLCFLPLEDLKTRFLRKYEKKWIKNFPKNFEQFRFFDKNWSFRGPKIMFFEDFSKIFLCFFFFVSHPVSRFWNTCFEKIWKNFKNYFMLGTLAFQYAALRAPAFGVPGASANL